MWRSVLLAAVVALAAAAVAAADPLDPKTRIAATDQASATHVLPTRDDLGSAWVGGQIKPVSLKMPRCPSLQPNFSQLTLTAHAESNFNNGNGGWQIDTDVTLLKTAKQVATQFALLLKPQLGTCVRYDVLKTTGSDPSVKLGLVKQLRFRTPATYSRAYRTTIVVTAGKASVTVYDDTLMLAKGRTSIWMNFVAPSSDEGPLELREQQLAKLLLGRIGA